MRIAYTYMTHRICRRQATVEEEKKRGEASQSARYYYSNASTLSIKRNLHADSVLIWAMSSEQSTREDIRLIKCMRATGRRVAGYATLLATHFGHILNR